MSRKGVKGSITVFLSLSCMIFLSLFCAVIESARVQGARTQTANITGMGSFSLLGEFERGLLEKYNIFSLDGTYGNGSFSLNKVNERLQDQMSYNANPKKDKFSQWCFDPWNLELSDSDIKEYALLTDQKGEFFYQQAVAYMKTNAAVIAADRLLDYAKNVDEIERYQNKYEEEKKNNDDAISNSEKQKSDKLKELESEVNRQNQAESEAAETGALIVVEPDSGAKQMLQKNENAEKKNPLKEIAKLRRKSTLEIVTWDKKISEKKIKQSKFPSKKVKNKGNMKLENKHSGMLSNVLFREYLMMYFKNYLSKEAGQGLDYQLEYILGGKDSDKKNLKYVVNRLLLIREGMNYVYCLNNPEINGEASSLSMTLTGFLGIPALTSATKHALLLAWAYGESLIDVRILLDHGKVPLKKDAFSWNLSLENLGRITEILREGAPRNSRGMSYDEYLRILLNMGNIKNQRMRALDMIQAEMQANAQTSGFKAENCIVGIRIKTKWRTKPVFLGLPSIVMGTSSPTSTFEQESSMSYET